MNGKFEAWVALIAAAGLLSLVITEPAFGQTGQLQPVQSALQTLVQTLTGAIAQSIAILSVIAAGFAALVGRFTWFLAGSIIGGIVLVFGSAQIVQFFQSAVGQ